MSFVESTRQFLGLSPAPLRAGFTLSERGARMPVCGTCGVLVAYEGQERHTQWHASSASAD